MRPKSIILLVLALGCGLVASIGINQVLANRGPSVVVDTGETEPIFVTMVDVEMGQPLTAEMVKVEDWPKDKVPVGAISQISELEDRRARTKLYTGEPILDAKLLGAGESGAGPAHLIPAGHRVVAVRVDSVSSGSSLILPGDRVDVLVHLVANQGKGIPETITRTILQDIKVFAVNEQYTRDAQDADEVSIAAKTIALLVKPDQAEMVTLASEMGEIRLVMRGAEDEIVDGAQGITMQQLLTGESGKSDRDGENLLEDPEGSGDDLNEFLLAQQNPAPLEQPSEDAWTMIVLEGQDARKLEFREDGVYETNLVVGPEGRRDATKGAKPDTTATQDGAVDGLDADALGPDFDGADDGDVDTDFDGDGEDWDFDQDWLQDD